MGTIAQPAKARVDAYIKNAPAFAREICQKLRRLMFKAEPEMVEDWKWGPHYGKNGMVCGLGAFKNHVSLAFFQGALMKDPKHLFIKENAPAKTMRRMKFTRVEEIHEPTLVSYIREAVALNAQSAEATTRLLPIPPGLKKILGKNKKLAAFFESLSYTHRKEYVRWIESAKKQETRESRLTQAASMLAAGVKHP